MSGPVFPSETVEKITPSMEKDCCIFNTGYVNSNRKNDQNSPNNNDLDQGIIVSNQRNFRSDCPVSSPPIREGPFGKSPWE